MADEGDDAEKTEDPSQKRLDEALRHGDVAKSQEVNTWFVTAASALVLLSFSASAAGDLRSMLRNLLANSYQIPLDGGALAGLLRQDYPAPAYLVCRCADAEAQSHFAVGGHEAVVLQTGGGQLPQGIIEAR